MEIALLARQTGRMLRLIPFLAFWAVAADATPMRLIHLDFSNERTGQLELPTLLRTRVLARDEIFLSPTTPTARLRFVTTREGATGLVVDDPGSFLSAAIAIYVGPFFRFNVVSVSVGQLPNGGLHFGSFGGYPRRSNLRHN